jgi:hypothetical protein
MMLYDFSDTKLSAWKRFVLQRQQQSALLASQIQDIKIMD